MIKLEYDLLKNLFEFLFQLVFVGPEIMGKLSQGRKGFPPGFQGYNRTLPEVYIRGAVWDSRCPEWGLSIFESITIVSVHTPVQRKQGCVYGGFRNLWRNIRGGESPRFFTILNSRQ